MAALKSGFLASVTQTVIADSNLNLEIRNNYLNVYFKGNSLLKLTETSPVRYKVEIDKKYSTGLALPAHLVDAQTTSRFVQAIPQLKQNIIQHSKGSLEIEYEQMIIRANNFEPRNNSEYFIVDRQYAVGIGRFDLTGIFWDRKHRRRGQEVPLCFMEVKFALNQDISDVHRQLQRYYDFIEAKSDAIAMEAESVFRQKLELGLYKHQAPGRLGAMKTLKFSCDLARYQFILVLVDYNPNSKKYDLAKLKALPFAHQIRVFKSGFAMWEQNVKPISGSQP